MNLGNIMFLLLKFFQVKNNHKNCSNKVKLVPEDIKNFIEKLDNKNKFDLIFLDPPYKDNSYLEILSLIKEKKILSRNHKIIIHRERKRDEKLHEFVKILIEKSYGRSKVIFGYF